VVLMKNLQIADACYFRFSRVIYYSALIWGFSSFKPTGTGTGSTSKQTNFK
jgi:hypothetical protein